MKILVCISNVPDTTTKVKFIDDFKKIDNNGIQWVINPWDELSLTRALELKDDPASGIQTVTVAHVGLAGSEPTLRKALAIGADDAIRINADAPDAYVAAAQLAEAIRNENFDMIFCGIESSDYNGSTVGGMLAEYLGWASVTCVSSVKIEGGQPLLTRELGGNKEDLTIPSPFVAIVQKGIANEPRIAAMRGIMMARTKPIKVVDPVSLDSLTEIISYELPKPRAACRFLETENAAELISLLHNQDKVF